MKIAIPTAEEARMMSIEAYIEANPNIKTAIECVGAAIEANAKKGAFDCTVNVNVELNFLEAIYVQSFFSNRNGYTCKVNDSKNGHTIIKIDWRTEQ